MKLMNSIQRIPADNERLYLGVLGSDFDAEDQTWSHTLI